MLLSAVIGYPLDSVNDRTPPASPRAGYTQLEPLPESSKGSSSDDLEVATEVLLEAFSIVSKFSNADAETNKRLHILLSITYSLSDDPKTALKYLQHPTDFATIYNEETTELNIWLLKFKTVLALTTKDYPQATEALDILHAICMGMYGGDSYSYILEVFR